LSLHETRHVKLIIINGSIKPAKIFFISSQFKI
jgi:hypothetical protein